MPNKNDINKGPTQQSGGPFSQEETVHGTTVAAHGRAALIIGASGAGKSALALHLMAFGAALVSDDRTQLWREGAHVMADAPEAIRGKIEARYVGILAAQAAGPQPVHLIVDLDQVEKERLPLRKQRSLLGLPVDLVHNCEMPHFAAAILQYLKHGRLD